MKIEWLIALYLFVSVAMIVFNFGFLLYERVHTRRFESKTAHMADLLGREIEHNADFPTDEHKRLLERKMRLMAGMESFDLTMEHLRREDEDKSERYLKGIGTVFDHLTYHLSKKGDLQRAYFAYIAKRWYASRPASETVEQALLWYVRDGSFYVRQNALEALSQVGSARAMAEAIVLLEHSDEFHSPKLVTEATLAFAGDGYALEAELVERFAGFSAPTKAAVVNYLRMAGRGDREMLLQTLCSDKEDREVRLACIRYFGRNHEDAAEEPLRLLAANGDPITWDYAAVAATALALYPSMEVLVVLKDCLSNPSWFVRHNAAKSLYDWGLSLDDLQDVMQGSDAYARDMLTYRWELESMQSEVPPQHEGGAV